MSQQQLGLARQDQDNKIKIEELTTALRQQDLMLRSRDEEIAKLREDNQNMFKDLRDYAESEESVKMELNEHKTRRQELETVNEEILEKSRNQELKIRNMQVELDKLRRESALKQESQRFVEKDLEALRSENEGLRDRLIQLETDRANMINERERKDRECKHLQNEVNRMNQMVIAFKNMQLEQQQQQFSSYDAKPILPINSNPLQMRPPTQGFGSQIENTANWIQIQPPQRQHLEQAPQNNTSFTGGSGSHSTQWQQNQHEQKGFSDYSPMKKSDPNVPYAQRQKMMMKQVEQKTMPTHSTPIAKPASANPYLSAAIPRPTASAVNLQNQPAYSNTFDNHNYIQQVQQASAPQNMQQTLQNLQLQKQRLEQEYQKMPITISKKSIQLQKRKEELEFELDAVDKNIAKITNKMKEGNPHF